MGVGLARLTGGEVRVDAGRVTLEGSGEETGGTGMAEEGSMVEAAGRRTGAGAEGEVRGGSGV